MRELFLAIFFAVCAPSIASAHPPLTTVELHWLCATQAPNCEGIEAFGDTAPHWVEKSAFFITQSLATWSECQRFGEPFVCIALAQRDLEHLGSFATPEHRHSSAALVYKGKAIAVMGFIGPTDGPLYVGGPDGAMSTTAVEALLTSVR